MHSVLRYVRSLGLRRAAGESLLPYRLSWRGGVWNTLVGVHLRRASLRRWGRRVAAHLPEDVTVLIPHRSRASHRTVNALRSIAAQRYPRGRIRVLLLDYGTPRGELSALEAVLREVGGGCLRIEAEGPWNRSHCLNIGLQRTATRYVMVTDADVLLAPDYLAECADELQRDILSAALCTCTWLPEDLDDALLRAAETGELPDLSRLRAAGERRTLPEQHRGATAGWASPGQAPTPPFNTGMVFTCTEYLRRLQGFDELLAGWGSEDDDLVRRLEFLGVELRTLDERTWYLHQWHPRPTGASVAGIRENHRRNADYVSRQQTIVRNRAGWGQGEGVEWVVRPEWAG